MEAAPPTLEEIRAARARLGGRIAETPLWQWRSDALDRAMGSRAEVLLKLELFQHAGSFKPRGALCNMLALAPEALRRGVTAVSAGNHAMAVGYAARALGTTAKVVMPRNANVARVQGCREYGVEVELVDDVHRAFARVREIEQQEGRTFIHPFEGPLTALGTATLGLEICEQAHEVDAVIVPIGGGGLCAGVSSAVKQLLPRCAVYGVEPEGADTMHRSFASGKPESIDSVRTIADSLGAPHAAPYSFALCRKYVDALVKVDDDAIRSAMRLLFSSAKLAVEPAGAAATAALCGPLRDRVAGKRVAVIVCGANIDAPTFAKHLGAAT
ncbi:MAG TPA: threonine/serine dehydratase [Myxococcales bacterium]|jgi:threonine dehydratase|nr:threonine/serine dehydratase [Myxococcales bacterium]